MDQQKRGVLIFVRGSPAQRSKKGEGSRQTKKIICPGGPVHESFLLRLLYWGKKIEGLIHGKAREEEQSV